MCMLEKYSFFSLQTMMEYYYLLDWQPLEDWLTTHSQSVVWNLNFD